MLDFAELLGLDFSAAEDFPLLLADFGFLLPGVLEPSGALVVEAALPCDLGPPSSEDDFEGSTLLPLPLFLSLSFFFFGDLPSFPFSLLADDPGSLEGSAEELGVTFEPSGESAEDVAFESEWCPYGWEARKAFGALSEQ